MQSNKINRRQFIQGSAAVLATLPVVSGTSFAQTTVRNRLEWHDFKLTSDYPSLINAISAMRANTNSSDPRSWTYWSNIHVRSCPHGIAYFLAWHRGYLHHFQQVLRQVSGNSTLVLPYWDYYANPNMPSEFTDPASGNPLYVPGRVNTNVRAALSLTPFSIKYKNFQRGTTDAFESSVEYRPHGSFHNVVGGYMAKMTSPMDPIFWLHHAQIDRLWAGWVAANAGRTMPPLSDAYWSGSFTYSPTMTTARNMTYDTRTHLGYDFANKALPTSLPPSASAAKIVRVQLSPTTTDNRLQRPPAGNFPATRPRSNGNRRSLGGARSIPLGDSPLTAQVALEAADQEVLRRVLEPAGGDAGFKSAQLVLENLRILPQGQEGGYYYDVYLNLPESGTSDAARYLVGGFGPFEIAAHEHHPGSSQLTLPITQVLRETDTGDLRGISVSFVRVSGNRAPRGNLIVVGEMRIELSQAAVE